MTEQIATAEVLEPGQRTLHELADGANHEHDLAVQSGVAMVEHAIRAGELLEEAFAQVVGTMPWPQWIAQNFRAAPETAALYRRMARYQDLVRGSGVTSITKAEKYMRDAPEIPSVSGRRLVSDLVVADMRRMRADGKTYQAIADECGVSVSTVMYWVRPATAADVKRRATARKKIQFAAEKALQRQQREQEIKRAVRKAGAAEQALYAMAEKMQDLMGQAHREATDREKRHHYSLAGEHYRKMRDEIVRGLGIT
jgi:transposase